ncbi:pseudouridine synthase 1 [Nomia melanderi]|uniref:pseudouridine synthase 1 n=1 Tax=Nomia melanderi TaxID=2448451 RepID=UPI0013044CF5|nr:tRNA pseudouridine synthase A [Nomia melanderi]XP_031849076.1 tRNA pseudouridine synthase A [Nomia melanderi]XP_031849077.1 tRNA pseudouridine synthase A [Nomia melanderi]XP_031849078.1 tRNA pseudouridine synthase A [Nomia melanderi]XP_031849079.1 tRNA pseudouridine synthase A [Nomia melanderi]XP_031849080.1 tRNA pseudouridine synthase A [Nomia melanderi]XP_031849081.1 tRNA pseudouridine synthase A [Nomia melanderi]XP_031849082.1 tRNA pseudouridine synthase A [Nomia melanderi]
MLYLTRSSRINNFFRCLKLPVDNFCQNMSVVINESSHDDSKKVEESNKRHITDEDHEVATKIQKVEATEHEKLPKRSNFVLMMGYLGKGYLGMQRNPGRKTIEEDLLTALFKSNLIKKHQFEDIRQLRFQRAARTDKNVSAVRQIVSLQLPRDVNKEVINEHLPQEIRIFGLTRVTKNFNSKQQCDGRTYRYVIPTYAFATEDTSTFNSTSEEGIDADERLKQISIIDGKPYNEYRLSKDKLDILNETLKLFEGTHNFHNFTIKVRPNDPSAHRYIMKFLCAEVFVENDTEFAVLEIIGQSFMLHQIRKMISLVIGICRNIITKDIIKDALSQEKMDIPIAPGLGLTLHHVHYTYYNKRYGNDGIHKPLNWEEYDKEVAQFYRDFILKDIICTEVEEKITLNWLATYLTPNRFKFIERIYENGDD